jgi:hypothetical protein
MKLVTRGEWGARSPRGQAAYLASTRGVKVHYTGGFVDPRVKDDHSRCAALARQIQNGHMDGNQWADVGYSFLACPHRYVFEGRGLHRLPAANGAGLNTGHYAVLGMVGNKGLLAPTDDMLHGICDAIDYVRQKGGAGLEVAGHRDGYATDCPGKALYDWVRAGALRPGDWMEEIVKALPTLKPNHSGEHVETLQALLAARSHAIRMTGVYDAATLEAVKSIQRWGGVKDDGVVGPKTWPILLRVHK